MAADGEKSARPVFFSLSDRIGRIRYLVYTLTGVLGLGAVLVGIYLFCLLLPDSLGRTIAAISFVLVKNVLLPVVLFVMSIRRLHDLGLSGWWSLTFFIPFVTVLLLLVSGQRETNRFGLPEGNVPRRLVVVAVLLPLTLFLLYRLGVEIKPRSDTGKSEGNAAPSILRSYPAD